MSEKMCKSERKVEKEKYECKKCGRTAEKEKHLCKPEKIKKKLKK